MPRRLHLGYGVATGLITAAVAMGIAQLVAGITGPQGSPVVAVGGTAIDFTPAPVKNFAISVFGSHDKTVLVTGILVVLAVFAAAIGVAAVRRLAYGYAGLAVFTAVGLAAALTRPTSGLLDAVPVVLGGIAGALVLRWLATAAVAATTPAVAAGPSGAAGAQTDSDQAPAPGAAWVPAGSVGQAGSAGQADLPPARALPPVSQPGRRRFLATGSAAVVVAGACRRPRSRRPPCRPGRTWGSTG
jgi:hypothetical protein